MTREEIFHQTVELLGTSGADPDCDDFDWKNDDQERVVSLGVAAGDWLLEQCFERTPAKSDWNKCFSDLLGGDTWFNLYISIGKSGEKRKFRLDLEVNDGDRIETYPVWLDAEEKSAFIALAEFYCIACERKTVDQIIREWDDEEI